MNRRLPLIQPEIRLALTILILLLWGGFTIYSSESMSNAGGSESFGWRQLCWGGIGMLFFLGAIQIHFERLYAYSWYLAVVVLAPLLLVWCCGIRINGMSGWYNLGGMFFQPSEIAKPFFLLLLCRLAATAKNAGQAAWRLATALLVFAAPLLLQPDFGTLLVYGAATVTVFWIFAGKLKWLILGLLTGGPLLLAAALSQQYILRRFSGYFAPESDPFGAGWHTLQLRYAIAGGGLTGSGLGHAVWSNSYLPYSYCDSAFAAMTETTGAIGGILVIALFLAIAVTALPCGSRQSDPIRRGFIYCGSIMIVIQAFIHISVNVTLFPVTGLTCPFISYGGSSLTGTLLLVGMMFSAMWHRSPAAPKAMSYAAVTVSLLCRQSAIVHSERYCNRQPVGE
ncbi:MAG: FtsW/RodA/SpoVE family cell cycle protein [Victivallales bacterium]|nr:FtsW/RodA/SpoVE family cell cycle protein [Victivallales bacterium]